MLALLLPLAPPALAQEATPPDHAEVQILYTGGSGGVGSVKYTWEALRGLATLPDGAKVTEIAAFHGALAQGDWGMWAPDGSVAAVLNMFNSSAPTCQPGGAAHVVQTALDTVVTLDPAPPAWLAHLGSPQAWAWSTCAVGSAQVTLVGPADAPPPTWNLDDWEFRRALRGTVASGAGSAAFVDLGRPLQEISRTVQAIQQLQQDHPDALYVDAGDWLDGASSVADGMLSLHRPNLAGVLQGLHPVALVPGNNELLAGAAAFQAEVQGRNLPYLVSNWSPAEGAPTLPGSVVRAVATPAGEIRVAFVGVLDPALTDYIPTLATDGVGLADPVMALQAEVDRLMASAAPPHAIVALTTASEAVQAEIRRKVRGVDVLIGDPTFATLRVIEDTVALRPLPRGAKGAAITLPMDGLAILHLGFDGGVLSQVRVQPLAVRADAPADPAVRAKVTAVRAKVYPALDTPLLDAPDPTQPLPEATWDAVICEAVRRQTRADTVLLRDLPPPPRQPGRLTEMMLLDQLAALDVLEVHEVAGDRLPDLLDKVGAAVPVVCGALPGQLYPRARGRLLEAGRTYRVVTTDRTRVGLDPYLRAVESRYPLDQPTHHVILGEGGQPLTLRMAALAGLRAARDARGMDGLSAWLTTDAPKEVLPLWLFRVRSLTVSGLRYAGVDDDAFASVPETLATAPDTLSLGLGLDTSVEYTSGQTEWDLRLRDSYGLLASGGADPAETADDLLASTSLALPRWTWPGAGPVRMMPYTELRLDSELTPTAGNPSQADLSALLGLSAARTMNIRGAHVGAFINEDLTTPGPPELGARLDLGTAHYVGDWLKIGTTGDLQLTLPTANDDASDLSLRAWGELKLAFPLAHWLDVAWYAQGFAIQGRVPETRHLGTSYALGVALDASAAFEL